MGRKGCWLSVQWMISFSGSQRRSDILGLSKDSCALGPLPGVLIQWFRMCPGPVEIRKSYANKADSYPRWCVCAARVQLFATPWTVAHQASLSMEFSRREYWSGLPFFSPGDVHNPGIEPGSPALHADSLLFELPGNCHYTLKVHYTL